MTEQLTHVCDHMGYSLAGSSVYGISSQEYQSGFPCPPPGLPHPRTEPASPALQADSLLLSRGETQSKHSLLQSKEYEIVYMCVCECNSF